MLFNSCGAALSSITKYLRISVIIDNGSIFTGHSSTQALQLVHAQISSFVIQSNKFLPSSLNTPLLASIFLPTSSNRSRVSIIILRGDNFLPVKFAGQDAVQRPHSVQVYAFNNCTQFKSVTSLAPNFTGSSFVSSGTAYGSAFGSIISITSLVTFASFVNCP